jgi:hypothetical protein
MALTLGSEQRLESVGLIDFFVAHEATWQNLANDTISG